MLPFFGLFNAAVDTAHDFVASALPPEAQEPFDAAHELAMTPARMLSGDTGRVPERFRKKSSDPYRCR